MSGDATTRGGDGAVDGQASSNDTASGPDRVDEDGREPGRMSGPALAWALFGGILAWLVHLAGTAWSVGRACATGTAWPIHLLTAVVLLVVAHALWVSWRIARAAPTTPARDAARLLGWFAIVLNVANLVLVVVEWAPVLALSPCAT